MQVGDVELQILQYRSLRRSLTMDAVRSPPDYLIVGADSARTYKAKKGLCDSNNDNNYDDNNDNRYM